MPRNLEKPNSAVMEKRRERIIEVLRKRIASEGIAGVTMRGLAKDSGVATKTLYNQFGSKDAIISLAVHSSFLDVMNTVSTTTEGIDAFNKLVNYALSSPKYNLSLPSYTSAMIYAYYAADRSLVAFHKDFHDYLTNVLGEILAEMHKEGDLRKDTNQEILARQLAESLINTTAEWTKNTLSDECYVDMSVLNILSLLHVHLTENYARKVATRIRQLHKSMGVQLQE